MQQSRLNCVIYSMQWSIPKKGYYYVKYKNYMIKMPEYWLVWWIHTILPKECYTSWMFVAVVVVVLRMCNTWSDLIVILDVEHCSYWPRISLNFLLSLNFQCRLKRRTLSVMAMVQDWLDHSGYNEISDRILLNQLNHIISGIYGILHHWRFRSLVWILTRTWCFFFLNTLQYSNLCTSNLESVNFV